MLILIFGVATANSSPEEETRDYVILLHGLGRTRMSMKRLESNLLRCGYEVINTSYPSTKLSIEQLANDHLDRIIRGQIKDPNQKVHFVTHSLGGIILRHYLNNHTINNLGRVVMLGPPNKGSEVADKLKGNYIYQKIYGPTGQELGTTSEDVPKFLGQVDFELGIIAGDRSFNPYFSYLIPGLDDGKVSVESAKVSGMKDFLVVHGSHTFIMQKKEVIDQTIYFLRNGRFYHRQDISLITEYGGQFHNSFGNKQADRKDR